MSTQIKSIPDIISDFHKKFCRWTGKEFVFDNEANAEDVEVFFVSWMQTRTQQQLTSIVEMIQQQRDDFTGTDRVVGVRRAAYRQALKDIQTKLTDIVKGV